MPDLFVRDAERLARFEREARTLASLNHPNIAAIYGMERVESVSPSGEPGSDGQALVMELVDGEDLASASRAARCRSTRRCRSRRRSLRRSKRRTNKASSTAT